MEVDEARAVLATMVSSHTEVNPTLKVAEVKQWLLGEISRGGPAGNAGAALSADHLDREAEKIVMAVLVNRTAMKLVHSG